MCKICKMCKICRIWRIFPNYFFLPKDQKSNISESESSINSRTCLGHLVNIVPSNSLFLSKKAQSKDQNSVPLVKNYKPSRCLYTSVGLQQCNEDDKFSEVYFQGRKNKTIYTLSSHWTLEWNAQLIYSELRGMPKYSTISLDSIISKTKLLFHKYNGDETGHLTFIGKWHVSSSKMPQL